MAAAGGLEAIERLAVEDFEQTHPKIPNPDSFRLPRRGALILREKVHKEVRAHTQSHFCSGARISRYNQGQLIKSVKERLMQLTISADNHVELAYTECGENGQVPNRWKNIIRLSRGPGSQWDNATKGEA